MASPWAGGAILLIFVGVALVLANLTATRDMYHAILSTPLAFYIGEGGHVVHFGLDVERLVNDGLMVLFFFVVGLEIKRELRYGRLSSMRQAMLPVAAAVGGMVVPAAIYAAFNATTDFSEGWGIPMATDIAFAIAVLSLMGNRVPVSLKVFLTALAIADDLGAVVVIAIFYTYKINLLCLVLIGALVLVLFWMRKVGVTRVFPYLAVGLVVWFLFYESGVHSTISGVIMAMLIPSRPLLSKKVCLYRQNQLLEDFRFHDREGVEVMQNEEQHHTLLRMRRTATDTIGMSQRLEHLIHPWVTFLVMPVFALANAGVDLSAASLNPFASTLGTGIFLGLVAGKPLGIMAASWLAVKCQLAVLPRDVRWMSLAGVVCMGGIGFTMSIFIDTLAFAGSPEIVDSAKLYILIASGCAALLGFAIIKWAAVIRKNVKKKFLQRMVNGLSK
jgi:NhaA family Na+:H+ antiporter